MIQVLKRWLDKESKRLIKNSTWVFLANFNMTVCFFLRSVILARVLGVELFGTLILIITVVQAIQELCNLNLPTALIKFGADYISSDSKHKAVAFTKASVIASILTACLSISIVVITFEYIYDWFVVVPGLHYAITLYAIAASLMLLTGLSSSLLRLNNKFRVASIAKMSADWIELAMIAGAILLVGDNLSILLPAIALALLLNALIYNGVSVWVLRGFLGSDIRVSLKVLKEDWLRIRTFILFNAPSNSLNMLMRYGDVLLLGALSNATQVGLFTIAKRLGLFVLRFTDPLYNSVYPQLASLVADRKFRETRIMLKRISTLLVFPVALMIAIIHFFGEEFIELIYGPLFREAVPAFEILLLAGGVTAVFFWIDALALSLGKVKQRLLVNVVSLSAGAILAIQLTPTYGAVGMAIGSLAIVLINKSLLFWYVSRALDDGKKNA